MALMAERTFYKILKEQLDSVIAEPLILTSIFQNEFGLSRAEAEHVTTYFTGGTNAQGETVTARGITLVQGYPRELARLPGWALTLANDQKSQEAIGEDWTAVMDADGDEDALGRPVDCQGRQATYTFQILVMAENADLTIVSYNLLKYLVLSSSVPLQQAGFYELDFSGADMAPDPRYLPADCYARVATVTISNDESWSVRIPGRGTRVTGIAIDTGNAKTNGNGSVDALVRPYLK